MFSLTRFMAPNDSGKPPIPALGPTSPLQSQFAMLIRRCSSATLHEDKRAAMIELQTLTESDPLLTFDTTTLSTLLSLAESFVTVDSDMTQVALTIIYTILIHHNDSANTIKEYNKLINYFVHQPAHVSTLLTFLTNNGSANGGNYTVRYYSIRILTLLLLAKSEKIQSILLSHSGNIPNTIIELLNDGNELIRNESLPLIESLIQGSQEIPKMLVFNGVIETLCHVIDKEGGLIDSGIIGEDAMRIIATLIKSNAGIQQLFGELGSAPYLAKLLTDCVSQLVTGGGDDSAGMSNESVSSLMFVLDIVYYASLPSSSLSSLSSLVQPLFLLSLLQPHSQAQSLSPSVKSMALALVAALIDGKKHSANQLNTIVIPHTLSLGYSHSLAYLIANTLQPSQSFQSLPLFVLQCYYNGNRDAQSLALSLVDSSNVNHDELSISLSRIILTGLTQSLTRAPSAQLLSHLVRNNNDAQQRLLSLTVSDARGSARLWSDSFIEALYETLTRNDSGNDSDSVSMLALLCEWLDNNSNVSEFLFSHPALVQFLITAATTHSSMVVRGLSCYVFLLSMINLQSLGATHSLTPTMLIYTVLHSITLDAFMNSLSLMAQSPVITDAVASSQLNHRESNPVFSYCKQWQQSANDSEHVFPLTFDGSASPSFTLPAVDGLFVRRFRELFDTMDRRLLTLLTPYVTLASNSTVADNGQQQYPAQQPTMNHYDTTASSADVARLQREMESLAVKSNNDVSIIEKQRQEIEALKAQLSSQPQPRSQTQSPSSSADIPDSQLRHKYEELLAEHEDLLLLLASYDVDGDVGNDAEIEQPILKDSVSVPLISDGLSEQQQPAPQQQQPDSSAHPAAAAAPLEHLSQPQLWQQPTIDNHLPPHHHPSAPHAHFSPTLPSSLSQQPNAQSASPLKPVVTSQPSTPPVQLPSLSSLPAVPTINGHQYQQQQSSAGYSDYFNNSPFTLSSHSVTNSAVSSPYQNHRTSPNMVPSQQPLQPLSTLPRADQPTSTQSYAPYQPSLRASVTTAPVESFAPPAQQQFSAPYQPALRTAPNTSSSYQPSMPPTTLQANTRQQAQLYQPTAPSSTPSAATATQPYLPQHFPGGTLPSQRAASTTNSLPHQQQQQQPFHPLGGAGVGSLMPKINQTAIGTGAHGPAAIATYSNPTYPQQQRFYQPRPPPSQLQEDDFR